MPTLTGPSLLTLFLLATNAAIKTDGGGKGDGLPDVSVRPGSKTTREVGVAELPWMKRTLVEPFKERTAGQSGQAEALAWVERVLDSRANNFVNAEAPALIQEGTLLVSPPKRPDPLIPFLLESLQMWSVGADARLEASLAMQATTMERRSIKGSLPYLLGLLQLGSRGDKPAPSEIQRAIRWMKQALADGVYTADEWPLFLRHLLEGTGIEWFDLGGEQYLQAVQQLNPPDWVLETVRGCVEIKKAWVSRGGDWGSNVTEEGWKGFHLHLGEARKALTRAWELQPDQPFASAEMLSVSLGDEEVNPNEWLERSLAARCDYLSALRGYIHLSMPRWGGSHEQMVAFATRCVETGRFDTDLPTVLPQTLNRILADIPDIKALYSHPKVRPVILRFSKEMASAPERVREREMRQSYLAINSWLADDPETSAAALKDLPGHLHVQARLRLQASEKDERFLRGEVATLTSSGRGAWIEVRDAASKGDFAAAEKALGKAKLLVAKNPTAAAFIEGQAAVLKAEKALKGSETVSISGPLESWVSFDGELDPKSAPTPGWTMSEDPSDFRPQRHIFGARVGGNFEARAEFAPRAEGGLITPVGLVFGSEMTENGKLDWHSCEIWPSGGANQGQASYLHASHRGGILANCELKPGEPVVLEVRVQNDQVSWKLNGNIMQEGIKLKKSISPAGRIGIGTFRAYPKGVAKLSKLEVRRLP